MGGLGRKGLKSRLVRFARLVRALRAPFLRCPPNKLPRERQYLLICKPRGKLIQFEKHLQTA